MAPGNNTIIDEVWLERDGVFAQALFGGNAGVTIASGELGAWTDDIGFAEALDGDGLVYVWTFYHTGAGENQLPIYLVRTHRGECVFGATGLAANKPKMLASSPNSTASLTQGYGTLAQAQFSAPDAMVAKEWDDLLPHHDYLCGFIRRMPNGDARRLWLMDENDVDGGGIHVVPAFGPDGPQANLVPGPDHPTSRHTFLPSLPKRA